MKIVDPYKASYGVSDPIYAMTQLAQTTMRSELGKMKLDNTLSERDLLNRNIVRAINEAAEEWGITCLRYEIKTFTVDAKMRESMAQESMAERSRRAEITRSEGTRQAAINVAEGKKQAVVLESEAAREDAVNRAEGEALAIRKRADAAAASIDVLGQAMLQPGGTDAAALRVADQYVASFGNLAKAGNTLIMPAAANDAASMVAQAMSVYSTMQTAQEAQPELAEAQEVEVLEEAPEAAQEAGSAEGASATGAAEGPAAGEAKAPEAPGGAAAPAKPQGEGRYPGAAEAAAEMHARAASGGGEPPKRPGKPP